MIMMVIARTLVQAPEWYREDLIGQAIQSSFISGADLLLTTKVHTRHLSFNSTLRKMQT